MGILGKRSRKEKEPSDRKAKPNGDTNRELIESELALMKYFRFEQNIVAFNVTGRLRYSHLHMKRICLSYPDPVI